MSRVVNLNKARKSRAKAEARKQADQNAISFGRTKTEKSETRAQSDKTVRELDGHKRK